jgi:hypothetical protein
VLEADRANSRVFSACNLDREDKRASRDVGDLDSKVLVYMRQKSKIIIQTPHPDCN